ncbi:hypothetical protein G6F68_009728 [Rhizopus microsporus]|nr:hypothetical protein G6F68_009728 [Rhizopus microsporus]
MPTRACTSPITRCEATVVAMPAASVKRGASAGGASVAAARNSAVAAGPACCRQCCHASANGWLASSNWGDSTSISGCVRQTTGIGRGGVRLMAGEPASLSAMQACPVRKAHRACCCNERLQRRSASPLVVASSPLPEAPLPCQKVQIMSPAVVLSPRPLALAVAALLAGSALTAQAETDATDIDTVHVTASQIARQALGTSTITAEDIAKRPPANDIAELLRTMPGVNLTGNSASGQYGNNRQIDLRGMGPENTLILVDGKRIGARDAVRMGRSGERNTRGDTNWVPAEMIERIEVLRGPAAARYGSGASGGVVNIITRQNFEGAEIGGSFGGADQGGLHEQNLKFVGGLGDLDTDGYNILFSLQGYNRERLDQDERNLTRSGIYTDKPGGRWNGWSAKGARYLVNGVSVPMLDANGNCPTGTTRVASAPIDGLAGDTCGFNQAPFTTLIPSTKRYQAYANARSRAPRGSAAARSSLWKAGASH